MSNDDKTMEERIHFSQGNSQENLQKGGNSYSWSLRMIIVLQGKFSKQDDRHMQGQEEKNLCQGELKEVSHLLHRESKVWGWGMEWQQEQIQN